MGLRIATNTASISAQRALGVQQKKAEHAAMALASGSRIVRAADDAAGLAISEGMKSEIKGLGQARNNAFNAISAIQVGEGSLSEIANILTRIKELSVQSANDTLGEKERSYLNKEATSLIEELDRIATSTRFGDKYLLDGSQNELEFQVGTGSSDKNIIRYDATSNATADELGVSGISIEDKESARDVLDRLEDAFTKVSEMRASYGAMQSRLESTVTNLDVQNENLMAAKSRIADADIAKETADMASSNILQSASVSVLAQANQLPQVALRLIG